jgi:heat-inducible transcriptional repressor
MRLIHPSTQETRKRKLLQAAIYHYVRTGKPVGSQIIVDKYNFGMSSATVRNMLVQLEKEGFLHQPHTSAGRIPTDKGYRFYVDSLLEIQSLASNEEDRIRKEYSERSKELQDVMVSTSHMLSSLSKYTGLVLSPRLDKSRLRRLQLIPLGANQMLVIVVSETGLIRHRVVHLDHPLSLSNLNLISTQLNERLHGMPLAEVRTQILHHIESIEREQKEVFSIAKQFARQVFDLQGGEADVYVEGRQNIFSFPEKDDYRQVSDLMHLIEHKNLLSTVLEKAMKKEGVSIKIGTENSQPELRGVSLVSSTYKLADQTVGVLGILGPKRMEYGRMIALVEGVARIMNQMLARMTPDE